MAKEKEARVTLKLFNTDFNKSMQETKSQSAMLNKEFELQKQQMKHTSTEAEQFAAKIEFLEKKQEIAANTTSATKTQYEQVAQKFGLASKEAETMQKAFMEAQIAEARLANQVKETQDSLNKSIDAERQLKLATENTSLSLKEQATEVEKTSSKLKKIGDSAKEASGKVGQASVSISKGFGAMAVAGAGAVTGIVVGTNELNMDLARLKANANTAGVDMKKVEDAMVQVTSVTGETDSAVETVSNLLATGFKDNQLAPIIEQINGAAIKFSDTLKTEGIADGIQETFATGEAIGPFAELLDRSGVDLDTFNKGLQEAQKQGQGTQYIMQTMSELGFGEVLSKYKELNPEITKYNEVQAEMKDELANLGVALAPILTGVFLFITKILEWTNANIELIGSFGEMTSGISATFSVMFMNGITFITNFINGIAQQIPQVLEKFSSIVESIYTLLSAAMPMLVESGGRLLKSLITGIINVLPSLINSAVKLIASFVSTLISNLPKIITSGTKMLKSLIQGITQILPNLISTALKLIVQFAGELIKNLPKIIASGVSIIGALIKGIVSMALNVGKTIFTDIVPQILKPLEDIDLLEIGVNIVEGLINGIGSMAEYLWKKVKSIGKGILDALTGELDTHSPSKETEKIGKWTSQGLAQGIEKDGKKPISAAKKVAEQVKAQFEKDKAYYNEKSKLGNMSISQELAMLEKMAQGYSKNSTQRNYFENQIVSKKVEINKQVEKINADYLKNVQALNTKLIEGEKKLNDEYQKAVDDRAKTLYGFVGLFDQVTIKEVTGDQLMQNLEGQLTAFENWTSNLTQLAQRGINEGLIAELQEMGVNAASEVAALNTLSDEQLVQYMEMWKQKHELAKQQAVAEMQGLKVETDKKILELRETTAVQLTKYQGEWKSAMVGVKGKVKNEMQEMPSIGSNAISGLISGLNAKKGDLIAAAQAIADSVKSTLTSALEIHSPSRVTRGYGKNIGEGLVLGMQDLTQKVELTARNLAESASARIQNNTTVDSSKTMIANVTVQGTNDNRRDIERALRRMGYQM